MADSNVVNISTAMTRDEIRAKAAQKYASEDFTPPDWDGLVKLRSLKAIEQDDLYHFTQDNTNVSIFCYYAKVCAMGMAEPKLTYDEALEMPYEFLKACAERIQVKTGSRDAEEKAADEPVPFVPLNSNASDLPLPSGDSAAKSRK